MLLVTILLLTATTFAQSSLRFYGHGVAAPDLDRVKIRVDNPANNLPGPPADIGATDFTIEFWLKADSADNTQPERFCGEGIEWIYGNIIFDRDRYNQSRKYGLSIANERFIWGVSGAWDYTICGATDVLDNQWHHVAVQHALDGRMWIWVDGLLDAFSTDGPLDDVSYPDNGVPGNFCGGPCVNSDPFIVLGAEKHDAGSEYPSYNGYMDELRLSNNLRYTESFVRPVSPFETDANTVALYHFDEASGDTLFDVSGAAGGPSNGIRRFGGSGNPGPVWTTDTPFASSLSDIDDLVIHIQSDGLIQLNWSAVAQTNSYRVYYSTSPDFIPPAFGTLLISTTSTTVSDNPNSYVNPAIYYRVIASTDTH